ncbi:MAG: helix-turn-helix transcriptional regulator [Pseudomonadota bacterium]
MDWPEMRKRIIGAFFLWRVERGFSYRKTAAFLDVSASHLANVEKGRFMPSNAMINKILLTVANWGK